jgi:hypothetical protein
VDLHWRPVGTLPAQTYWRRRAAVLLVAVVALLVAVTPLLGGGDQTGDDGLSSADRPGDAEQPASDPPAAGGPDASAGADPTPSPEPPAEQPCPDEALEVTASSDATDYAVGGTAALALTVRNTGTQACRRALGQGAVELIVTSGPDRVWSSDDCAPGGEAGDVVLEPGAQRDARASWSTVRSAPGCPPDQPPAQPGTYQVTARVGELEVPGAVFTVSGG